MKRFESLDWLRGLMAFAIMIYHLIGWQLFHPESGSVLGNFGVYGVSIFFVLSGLSMGIVYNNYIKDLHTSFVFFVRRLFRLLPLLWIAIAVVSGISFILHGQIDLYKIFLNATLLFGFVAPAEYINIGAWSIGNETFYYAFTPLLIMLYAKHKQLGNLAVLGLVAVGIYFAFYALDSSKPLSEQWQTYINPFNNFFLYACGLALYYNFHEISMKNIASVLVLISLAILCLYPVAGDQINITTGVNRVVFALASIALTLGFYKLEIELPNWFSKPFANLGEATYGVYLLHPVVYMFVNKVVHQPVLCIIVTSVATIIAANISYRVYEKPFIKIGKKSTTFEVKKIEQVS
ncbi:acyltransferase family protein [Acinetobacter sp. 742879]|uniref:acyltransferase family protein n=1 Tax=Acinetobacter sp. 742879 TaxID=1310791 RepID=UPI00044A827F|nr:acyltransferase [Acinetobacter sp. 742879]EXS29147.1 acyltransferase family protein [Acinetobacter sp. 742879]